MTPAMESVHAPNRKKVPEEMAWRVHPLAESVWRSALLIGIITVTCIGAWLFTGWPGMAIVALIVLVISLAPYLFPVHYRMDSRGIEIVFLGVRSLRAWEELKNFYPHDVGVHLSTFRRPSGLDAFRGSFIRFAPGNGKLVLKFLEKHIKRDQGESGSGKPSGEGGSDSGRNDDKRR